MALDDSALNEEALNEDIEGDHADGTVAVGGTVHEFGPHQRIIGGLGIIGGPFYRQVAHETIRGTLGILGTLTLRAFHETVQGGLGLAGTATTRGYGTQHVEGGIGLEPRLAEFPPNSVPTAQPIQASVVLGVLPQQGSAIFTSWRPTHIKENRVQRHWDLHESSGLDDDATRHRWELAINVSRAQLPTHWTFIKDHFGSGKAFYFYDLQANGFQYDGTGVLTDGRYKVRFDTNPIPQILQEGFRFVIEYAVLEVE